MGYYYKSGAVQNTAVFRPVNTLTAEWIAGKGPFTDLFWSQ